MPFLGDLRLPTRQVTGVTRAPNAPGANSTPQDNCLSICRRRAARGTGHLQRMQRRRGKYSGAELNNANKSGRPRGDERAVATPTRSTPPASLPRKTSAVVKNTLSILVLGYYTILKLVFRCWFRVGTQYWIHDARISCPLAATTAHSYIESASGGGGPVSLCDRAQNTYDVQYGVQYSGRGGRRSSFTLVVSCARVLPAFACVR